MAIKGQHTERERERQRKTSRLVRAYTTLVAIQLVKVKVKVSWCENRAPIKRKVGISPWDLSPLFINPKCSVEKLKAIPAGAPQLEKSVVASV